VLTSAKKYEKPAELIAHNFYAKVEEELCTGCTICVDRCQMEAIQIENRKAVINLNRCIGCGLCVTTCKPEAMRLMEKTKKTIPPRNAAMLYLGILSDKVSKRKMMANMLKLLAGKQL
jgi:heterodisulfide reductase subunit A-like polyferredoxin